MKSPILPKFFGKKHGPYLVLLLVPLLLYWKSLWFDFSPLDENWMIENNGWFLDKWSNLKVVFSHPTSLLIYYRPLLVTTTMLDYQLGNLDPFYYHVDSLLWHLCTVLLLFAFLLSFQVSIQRAFFFALIFAVHPIMLHAVAWIPGRNDTMLSFFMLSSLLVLNRYLHTHATRHLLLFTLLYVLALLTKENAIFFPLLYVALVCIENSASKRTRTVIIATSFTLALAFLGLYFKVNSTESLSVSNIGTTVVHTALLYLAYFGKLFLPLSQSVTPLFSMLSAGLGVISVAVLYAVWWKYKVENTKTAGFGVLIMLVLLLLPIVSIAEKPQAWLYEHRLYPAMIGFILLVSQIKLHVFGKNEKVVAAAILVFLMAVTSIRMNVYQNKDSFLEQAIASDPNSYFLHFRKGELLDQRGDFRGAIECFSQSLKASSSYGKAYFARANAYLSIGDKKNALDDYALALHYSPEKVRDQISFQRCIAYEVFDEPELALSELSKLQERSSRAEYVDLEHRLKETLYARSQNKIESNQVAQAKSYAVKGLLLMEQKQYKEALANFKLAHELEPGNAEYESIYKKAAAAFK